MSKYLFPDLETRDPVLTDELILKVIELMQLRSEEEDVNQLFPGRPRAGYTYWGQFISHDLVPMTRNNENGRAMRPVLDLSSVYGSGSYLENLILFDQHGCFSLNREHSFDILRAEGGQPLIPERRNDENVIVLQFHLLWQKAHNFVVTHFFQNCAPKGRVSKGRQAVTAIFHYLLINDFLKATLDKDVHDLYFGEASAFEDWILQEKMDDIPPEFSLAAFRFGHSMVRGKYRLRSNVFKSLSEILRSTSSGGIDPEFELDWEQFFGPDAQPARRINLLIEEGMGNIPDRGNIVELNLIAGNCLPSVTRLIEHLFTEQRYRSLLGAIGFDGDALVSLPDDTEPAGIAGVFNNNAQSLPLWFYILEESNYTNIQGGNGLGKLGSVIVAEVVRQAITNFYGVNSNLDLKNSIYDAGGGALDLLLSNELPDMHTFIKLFCTGG